MFLRQRSPGYILKKEDIDEADQVFSIYSRNFGKIRILARSSRRLNSKLKSFVQVFSLVEIEFIQGKSAKTLTDAVLIESFKEIKDSFLKLRLAYNFAKAFDALVKAQEADKKLWELLGKFFSALKLEKEASEKLEALYLFFFWKLLNILGYQPELNACVCCRKKPAYDNFFWLSREGGLVCKKCLNKVKARIDRVKVQTLKILRFASSQDWEVFRRLRISQQTRQDLKIISKKYFSYLYEKK